MRAQIVFSSALLLGAATVGCFSPYSNEQVFLQGDGGSGGTGGTGGSTTTTTTTETDPDCVPSTSATPVAGECGIFVSASKGDDATGDGSKEKPLATLPKAVETAGGMKPVYACAEPFTGPITIGGSVLIYGGLDCANNWEYVGGTTPTEISAPADQIPLTIGPSFSVELQDTRVVAADATIEGGSSIAVLVQLDANLSLVRGGAEAGVAMNGVAGAPYGAGAADGQKGADGAQACSAGTVLTPDPPINECGDPDSVGGAGGVGMSGNGASGSAGEPADLVNGGDGDAFGQCAPGTKGGDGLPGAAGPGALGLGTLNTKKGFLGVSGTDGTAGKPGQGGGGGGASRGGVAANKCTDAAKAGGASGGTGGSGGCGGLGGKGGGPGGSSIAIVSFGKALKFDNVKIAVKAAGAGGDGGPGQFGGLPAGGGAGGTLPAGATLLKPGCGGGSGGDGGQGGRGGGGLGGHSIGVAHNGSTIDGTPDVTMGAAGDGGIGDGDPGKGAAGVAQPVQEF